MVLLWTSYMYGGFLEYYFRLQFSAFWSMHDKTSSWENANFKMYPSPPPKKKTPELSPEKSSPRPPTTWKISNTLTKNTSHWEYLNPMRNLKLLEKYQPDPPPPPSKKENLNLQENEETSLLVKVSTTLKLPQPLWKSLKPPTWKFSISQQTLTLSEKFSTHLK